MINCSQLDDLVVTLPLVQHCDRVGKGALRISTPFCYPNGEKVDVFLDSDKLLLTDDLLLSDCGQTASYLHDAQVPMDATARRRELIADILHLSGVSLKGLQLTIRPRSSDASEISQAIFRLSQTCVRISDLATHMRLRSANPFKDDVEEFFEVQGLSYQTDVKLPPVFGKRDIKMDFEVRSGNRDSYVNIVAAMNDTAAHASALEITTKVRDLTQSSQYVPQRFVTVYNSQSQAIRVEDLERLATMSEVVSYPEEMDTLLAILQDNLSITGNFVEVP